MKSYPDVSIIVAVRNEEANITHCIKRIIATCEGAEVLVVDGGNDSTGDIVTALTHQHQNLRYIRNTNDRGKGHATRVGLANASRKIIAQVDADMQFPPEQLPSIIDPILLDETDVVLGSRFAKGSIREKGSQNLRRAFGNWIVSGLASILYQHRLTDVMAGFKAWKREVTESFELTSDRYSYEVEIPVKALQRGWRVVDIPILTTSRTAGISSVKVFREGLRTLRDIIRFRFFENTIVN